MLQPVRCIKFGEILLDENRRMLLLCSQCHTDYEQLYDFQQHLDYCRLGADGSNGAPKQSIYDQNLSLVFPVSMDSQHLLGRYIKGNQELQVYKYNGFKRLGIQQTIEPMKTNTADDEFMDLIKIEEELLDPRWYTELSSAHMVEQTVNNSSSHHHHQTTASYNELVEAVTPFVQFKENLKTNDSNTAKMYQNLKQPTNSSKNHILNGAKTKLTTTFTNTQQQQQQQDGVNMKPNTGMVTRRLPTLPKTHINGRSTNNIVKLLPVKQQLQQPKKANTLETCTFVSPPKQTLQTLEKTQPQPQQQQKRRIVKLLLTSTTAPSATSLEPPPLAICQPTNTTTTTLLAPIMKTEYHQVNEIKEQQPLQIMESQIQMDTNNTFTTNFLQPTYEIIQAPPAKTIQTQQILNKLQTLGLQVKRKQPLNQPQQLSSTSAQAQDPAKEKTLQLLKKLQSKGMNVKIVQSTKQQQQDSTTSNYTVPPQLDHTSKRVRLETNMNHAAVVTQRVPLNGNLIIRKLN